MLVDSVQKKSYLSSYSRIDMCCNVLKISIIYRSHQYAKLYKPAEQHVAPEISSLVGCLVTPTPEVQELHSPPTTPPQATITPYTHQQDLNSHPWSGEGEGDRVVSPCEELSSILLVDNQ